MECHLTPNEPIYTSNEIYSYISISNPIMWGGYPLQWLSAKNKVEMNRYLGEEPAPESLSFDAMMKYSGVYLYIYPFIDLSYKEYLILFKIEHYSTETDVFEIYHNGDRVDTKTLPPGDNIFAIIIDGCVRHRSTNLFFRNADFNSYPWFKEIEIQVI